MARKTETKEVRAISERIQCAHETCSLSARVRIQTVTGWASLCLPHYERHYDDIARANLAALGLDQRIDETKPEWRKRMISYVRERTKPKTFQDASVAEDEWAA